MGRPRGFDPETALEQALLLFWQHGYEGTSMTMLTTAMDIRPTSLYGTFGDKRMLFSEVVDRYQRTYGAFAQEAISGESTAYEAIERLLREAAQRYTEPQHPPGCLVITAGINHGPGSAEIEKELREIRRAARRAMVERIAADIEAGLLPADADAEALGTFYAATVQGMSRQAQDGATAEQLDRAVTLALAAWPATGPPS